mmetsp:Transcript_10200/g.19574  ORF Transcript_10200/g.19574 Transcript_10200/m.19574 type:complete len:236 (+) Transcript_10200:113-820(+)|eukprot:scaffold38144_cov206-Amphora_coffeaeformis.AAC.1
MISFLFASIWQDEEIRKDGDVLAEQSCDSSASDDGSGVSAIAVDPEEELLLSTVAITTRHVRFTEEKNETFTCPYKCVNPRELWYSKQDYAGFRQAVATAVAQKRAASWYQSLIQAHQQLKKTHNNRQVQWIVRNADEEHPLSTLALGLEQTWMTEERNRCRKKLSRKLKQCQQQTASRASGQREYQIRKACVALTRPSRLLAQYNARRVAVSVQRDNKAWRQFGFLDQSSFSSA